MSWSPATFAVPSTSLYYWGHLLWLQYLGHWTRRIDVETTSEGQPRLMRKGRPNIRGCNVPSLLLQGVALASRYNHLSSQPCLDYFCRTPFHNQWWLHWHRFRFAVELNSISGCPDEWRLNHDTIYGSPGKTASPIGTIPSSVRPRVHTNSGMCGQATPDNFFKISISWERELPSCAIFNTNRSRFCRSRWCLGSFHVWILSTACFFGDVLRDLVECAGFMTESRKWCLPTARTETWLANALSSLGSPGFSFEAECFSTKMMALARVAHTYWLILIPWRSNETTKTQLVV